MTALLDDIQLLTRLVALDTTSRLGTLAIVDQVCDYLDRPGIDIERFERAPGHVSLLATTGPQRGDGAGLLLSGHVDTVPPGTVGWTNDPLTATARNGRLYGRGTCDMKGFDALAMNTLVAASQRTLEAPLALLFTCDEEVGSLGAEHVAGAWGDRPRPPRRTIIGEPTSLSVVRMHKGHLKFSIDVRGKSAHTGSPHLGHNAIDDATLLLTALRTLQIELAGERTASSTYFDEVPFVVLAVVGIAGGTASNVIPDACTISCGVRVLPGMNAADIVERVRAVLAAVPDVDWNLDVGNDNPPLFTDDAAPMHNELCAMVGQSTSIGVSFASDGGYLARLDIEPVLFGPGSISVAHQPDEFVPLDEMARAADIVERCVHRCCDQNHVAERTVS